MANIIKKTFNPRMHFYDHSKGELSPGELRIFDKLYDMGHDYYTNKRYMKFKLDPLVESAFNTSKNEEWAKYHESDATPKGSLESESAYDLGSQINPDEKVIKENVHEKTFYKQIGVI